MRIDLCKKSFNASLFSSITLRDPTCKASTSNSTYVSLKTGVNQCHTEKSETYGHIVYKNTVKMVGIGDKNLVIRDKLDRFISFSCSFNRSGFSNILSYTPKYQITTYEGEYCI